MGVQLGNARLRRSRRHGDVLSIGRALPELDPTQPAKLVPFQAGANTQETQGHSLCGIYHPEGNVESNRRETAGAIRRR